MIFEKTKIDGALIITRTPDYDVRGSFSRFYCKKELENIGIFENFKQMNVCVNEKKGTLRGLHYQKGDALEDKVVACIRGRIFDVCVDIRTTSNTFCQYVACELSESNNKMFYIPKGCAHGYVTLEDNSHLFYMMSEFYVPDSAAGYKYDDPAFAIKWPIKDSLILSEKDKMLPTIFSK